MNKQNWQKIYLDHSPKLLGICRRYIADLQTAEDLLQDSFINAIQKKHQLKDEKALFGWLKTIVVNNALQHLRKNAKEIFVSTEISEIPDTHKEMNTSISEEKHILAYDFTREELLKSIDRLPPHHKSVFNLYCIENHSHAEISQLLGINVNTSKSHLLRAKKSIQNYLLQNIVNQNTPKNKKKITQLLVFLGFSGLVWAQTFQSKFADFSISPTKNFTITDDVKTNSFSTLNSNHSFKKKLIISATFLLILFISIAVKKGNHSFLEKFSPNKPSVNLVNENKTEHNISSNINPENIEENNEAKKLNETNLNQKTEIEKAVAIENKPKEKALKLKDSIENTPKKVIIVKKIIQRDTIFIER